jgi:2-amino-4-hydroxy-6-hydroxymethyldihydropteridine diphosphokinase
MSNAYLSLGSNLGDREGNLRECLQRLGQLGIVFRVSSLYETEPMELSEQPWFLNCAVSLETGLNPEQLLTEIQRIEAELGRNRVIDKGPRTVDVDILLFDDLILQQKSLQIPHPAMTQRRFVLAPLHEIAPAIRHPVSGKTIEELLGEVDVAAGKVERLAK